MLTRREQTQRDRLHARCLPTLTVDPGQHANGSSVDRATVMIPTGALDAGRPIGRHHRAVGVPTLSTAFIPEFPQQGGGSVAAMTEPDSPRGTDSGAQVQRPVSTPMQGPASPQPGTALEDRDLGSGGTLSDAYRGHQRAVHGLARRLCGPDAADDITQDVFLQLWHRPDRFDPSKGTLRTFLLTITHHRAVDHVRAQAARQRRENTASPAPRTSSSVVEDEIVSNDVAVSVRDAVDALPPREREAIVTAIYGQCTYSEAAVVLDVAEGTIKSRIRAGMRRLSRTFNDADSPARNPQEQSAS